MRWDNKHVVVDDSLTAAIPLHIIRSSIPCISLCRLLPFLFFERARGTRVFGRLLEGCLLEDNEAEGSEIKGSEGSKVRQWGRR